MYVGETGRTGTIRIKEHNRAFKAGDLRYKLIYHALETDQMPNFEMVKVLTSGVSLYESRVFLEGVYTELQPAFLSEAMTISSEYIILY